MKINQVIHYISNVIFTIFKEVKISNTSRFRIEEIDTNTQTVIIRNRGARHVFLKLDITKTISDPVILSNLLPLDACWLGYYSGIKYNDYYSGDKKATNNRNKEGFKLQFINGRFKIHSQDRKGNITYLDTKTNKLFTENPLSIAESESLIMQFDPTQACYIGILAGMHAAKIHDNALAPVPRVKPKLSIIK